MGTPAVMADKKEENNWSHNISVADEGMISTTHHHRLINSDSKKECSGSLSAARSQTLT